MTKEAGSEAGAGLADEAVRKELVDFRVGIWKIHVEHVRHAQGMRYEILRYTIIGLAIYFSFLMSQVGKSLMCSHPDTVLLGLPVFVLAQVFVYISLLNRNITKHGEFLKYLFEQGLEPLGLGPNMYREFIRSYRASTLERLLERGHLHYSQLFVLLLMLGCAAIHVSVDVSAFAGCDG
jgi:hypothetical protein